MLTDKFNSENNRVETILYEDIATDDILNHYAFIRRNKELPRNLKVLIDASKAKLRIDAQDIRKLEKAVNVTKLKYERIREAIVIDKQYEFVMTTLSSMISKGNLTFKPFPTIKAASEWLSE